MGFTIEPWAKEWLEKERKKGKKCLEIKISNGNHYVYSSTSRYDRETKKPKKVSVYLGSLSQENGFVPKEKDARKRTKIVSIKETGTVRVLGKCSNNLLDILKSSFPDCYDQLFVLSVIRCLGNVPLKRASSVWEKYENVWNLKPAMSPKSLSDMLDSVGNDRDAQNRVFAKIDMNCKELAFDLSEFFSSSETVSYAEDGYNPEHENTPQINVALVCSQDTGIPLLIRMLPGSIRDVKTVCNTVKELNRKDVTMVMDRGFYSDINVRILDSSGLKFVFPLRRNCVAYRCLKINEYDTFEYHERLIRFGKQRYDKHWLYFFKDEELRLDEEKYAFAKYREGLISKKEIEEKKNKMGVIAIISNLDLPPEQIYLMFKRRDKVEKRFRCFKSDLEADVSYLRSNVSVAGHVFVSFLSMYILANLENHLRTAGMLSKYSALDVLTEYSKSYALMNETGIVDYEIPKKLEDLDKKLGLDIFPILRS